MCTEGKVNMVSVQSKLEHIAFKKKMECSYAQNPYTNHQLRLAISEDVVQHMSTNNNWFNAGTNGGDDNVCVQCVCFNKKHNIQGWHNHRLPRLCNGTTVRIL